MSKYELTPSILNPQATLELNRKSLFRKSLHGNMLITLLDIYMEAS